MAFKDAPTPALLENVMGLIQRKVEKQSTELVKRFVSKFYGNLSRDDLFCRNDSELYGAAISLWNALNQRKGDEPYIRVYNPELTRHGWQSSHTIVEIILNDTPFLVDSIRMALSRHSITAHLLLHQPLHLVRTKAGRVSKLLDLDQNAKDERVETVFLIEIDRQTSEQELVALSEELHSVVTEVRAAVSDWTPMLERLNQLIKELPKQPFYGENYQREEALEFLKWVADHNFTLMGYRSYDLVAVEGIMSSDPIWRAAWG